MLDHIKCMLANKYTLSGYSMIVAGIAGTAIAFNQQLEDSILVFTSTTATEALGIYALIKTELGMETYRVFKRTKEHIRKMDTIGKEFQRRNLDFYCNKAGIKLAAKEAGLEEKLLPQIKNTF